MNWLEKKAYISKSIIKAYEKECEFIHCNIYSMDEIQIASKNKENKLYAKNYVATILTTNLIILFIVTDFMNLYPIYSDEIIIDDLSKKIDILSKKANEAIKECDK